jgi:hypothetical protein
VVAPFAIRLRFEQSLDALIRSPELSARRLSEAKSVVEQSLLLPAIAKNDAGYKSLQKFYDCLHFHLPACPRPYRKTKTHLLAQKCR